MFLTTFLPFTENQTEYCPFEFTYDQGRCYKYEGLKDGKDDRMSMSKAQERCKAYDHDASNLQKDQFELVSVRDQKENEVITKILQDAGNRNPYTLPWIGLKKFGAGSWTDPAWSDESLILYTKWGPDAPSEHKVCS